MISGKVAALHVDEGDPPFFRVHAALERGVFDEQVAGAGAAEPGTEVGDPTANASEREVTDCRIQPESAVVVVDVSEVLEDVVAALDGEPEVVAAGDPQGVVAGVGVVDLGHVAVALRLRGAVVKPDIEAPVIGRNLADPRPHVEGSVPPGVVVGTDPIEVAGVLIGVVVGG
jgi:hypothetical protein